MLIGATIGRYHQMHNLRKHHGIGNRRIEKSDEALPIEPYGSTIDKAAQRKYVLKKLTDARQTLASRARFNRWYAHFKKYNFKKYYTVYN